MTELLTRRWVTALLLVGLLVAAFAVGLTTWAPSNQHAGEPGALAQPAAQAEPSEAASEAAEPGMLALPTVTYEVFLARDPFEPLTPPSGGTGGTGGPTASPSEGGLPAGCTQGQEVICDGIVVSLVDVYTDDQGTDRAVVQVDDQIYDVESGQTFATSFRVMSIDPPCVTLLYGDDGFVLCEGEQVLK